MAANAKTGVAEDAQDERDPYPDDLGPTLRALRKAAGLTLEELAATADLSQPFLSQIENGRALPSLLALHRVAHSLGTSTYDLLQPGSVSGSLVRRKEGMRFALTDGATAHWLTSGTDHRLAMSEIVAAADVALDHTSCHAGEEIIHVLEGSLTVFLDGHDDVFLETGDTLSYAAETPHRWKSGADGTRFMIVCTPPSF